MGISLPQTTLVVPDRAFPQFQRAGRDEWLLSFTVPAKARVWSANARVHHFTRQKLTEKWRTAAREAAAGINQHEGRWYVQGSVPFRRESRRDPHNFQGTVVKAVIDGLTDAGFWPDDTPEWVVLADPICRVCPSDSWRHLVMGVHALRLDDADS